MEKILLIILLIYILKSIMDYIRLFNFQRLMECHLENQKKLIEEIQILNLESNKLRKIAESLRVIADRISIIPSSTSI